MSAASQCPISPELALVCPELRARALSLLPAINPDALFRVPDRRVAVLAAGSADAEVPFLLAVAAYATACIAMAALRAATTVAVVAALAVVLTLLV